MLLFLLFALSAHAGIPPRFDVERYRALIARAGEKGDLLEGDHVEFKVLKHLEPAEVSKPHRAEYFSAAGGFDSNGHFGAFEVWMESEDWRIRTDGNWEIEERGWHSYTDGTLVEASHTVLVESPSGSVLDMKTVPTKGADDPEEQARWVAKLAEWYGWE
jgi:hypothetical protein